MATTLGTYRHEGAFGASRDLCRSVVVPAVRAAVHARRHVLLCCAAEISDAVLADLGDGSGISVVRDRALGARTPVALGAYQELLRRESTDHGELLMVTDGSDRSAGWGAWMRTEAMLNAVLAPFPVEHLCLMDPASTPAQARAVAWQTHPLLREEDGVRRNPDYREPADVLAALDRPVEPDPLETTEPALAVLDVEDPRVLRRRLTRLLRESSLSPDAAQDFVLAIDEVLANATEHGIPPVAVRLWASGERLLCAVTDHGSCFDDPTAGYGPAHHGDPALGGMGLWLARRSVDVLSAQRTDDGCVVRLLVQC